MSKYQYQQLDSGLNQGSRNVSGDGLVVAGTSGRIAAGLLANDFVFGIRIPADYVKSNVSLPVYLERVEIDWTCLTAFTVPVTAGRRLSISRASVSPLGGSISGGQTMSFTRKSASQSTTPLPFATAETLIATTGALTVVNPASFPPIGSIGNLSLSGFGNAGNTTSKIFRFTGEDTAPVKFVANDCLIVWAPQTFDAGGEWEFTMQATFQYLPDTTYSS
jgi:hypothetical protein